MNINAERFFALTALLAAPLVAAPACVINDTDDDGGSNSNANTDSTDPSATVTMTGTDSTDPSATTMSTTDSTTVGTGDTTGDEPTGGTTDDPTGDTTDGTTGGVDLGNCCLPDGSAGCEVPEVQDCVCEADAFCCDTMWDATCASQVESLGCGDCNFPPMPLDCYCLADCDGTPVEGPWQVCGDDLKMAAAEGQASCEDDLSTMGCMKFSCDECDCFTAEVPEIDCK